MKRPLTTLKKLNAFSGRDDFRRYIPNFRHLVPRELQSGGGVTAALVEECSLRIQCINGSGKLGLKICLTLHCLAGSDSKDIFDIIDRNGRSEMDSLCG